MSKEAKPKLIKPQTREINVTQISSAIDDSTRTVEIAFMSEEPVVRDIDGTLYNEIILTTPDNVDLSRLNNGGALLYNHNMDWLIGVVENARIDEDRVGRALVRFSTGTFADQKYKQVQEAVLTKISFGYNILDYYFEGNNLIVTRVQPYEISFVSVPADDSVGVGRSLNTEENNAYKDYLKMDEKDIQEVQEPVEQEAVLEPVEETVEAETETKAEESVEEIVVPEVEVELEVERQLQEAKDALKVAQRTIEVESELEEVRKQLQAIEDAKAEQLNKERIREIESIAKVFEVDPSEAINTNVSVEDFKRGIETQKEKSNKNLNVKDDNKMKQKRTIDALVEFAKGDHNALNDLEMGSRGYAIAEGEFALARANTTTVTAAGAIQTEYSDDFIRPLLAESILGRLGLEVLTGMNNREFTIPRLTSLDDKASFKFYNEGEAIAETVANFDNVVLKPRLFAGAIPVTKSLMLSSPDIGTWVQRALLENVANSLEKEVIAEVEATATKMETAASGTLSDADIEAALQKLLEANIRSRECVAIVSPQMYARLRQTAFLSNVAGVALAQGMRFSDSQWLCEEMPLIVSTFVADDTILMGNFSFVTIANWIGSTLDVDTTTYRSSLTTVFRNYHYLDIVQKHPESVIQLKVKA
ncbi:TPA: HK97 family phage prohead protease [Salmonella enterica subsp. enterica serovar Schwarzengrund]